MKKLIFASALLAAFGATSAHEATYNVTTTWFEPQTKPRHTIFVGSFVYDSHDHSISGLTGQLSESMTDTNGMPIDADHMVWLSLNHQLESWHDDTLGGTFAAVFKNPNTLTFYNDGSDPTVSPTDHWSPEVGVAFGAAYYGFPVKATNPGNAYALIFVPDSPLATLTESQLRRLAYADCTPTAAGGMMMGGGMMGAVCMTGTSDLAGGYGAIGTMDGFPLSQSITAVPEPGTCAMLLAGAGVLALVARRRWRA